MLIEQVEFADVIVISKIDLISSADREELTAILGRLNTHAEILPVSMGGVPLAKDPRHRPLRLRARCRRAGLAQGNARRACSGNRSVRHRLSVYLARRPFHPQRFHSFLNREWTNGRLLRSKGYFWLASRPQEAGSWSQAGGLMRYDYAGRWWRFTPEAQWPKDDDSCAAIRDKWDGNLGDCRQEFIGQHIDSDQLRAELDDCLLSDTEWNLGPEHWLRLPDPFGSWRQDAA